MDIQEHIHEWGKQWLYIEHLYSKFALRYGLTFAASKALDRIYHETTCTQKYLCQSLNMPKQTVSSFMMNLKKQGLVTQSVSDRDRRQCVYCLTPDGQALCERIFPALDKIEYQAFLQLSEREREAFTSINAKLSKLVAQGMEKEEGKDGC